MQTFYRLSIQFTASFKQPFDVLRFFLMTTCVLLSSFGYAQDTETSETTSAATTTGATVTSPEDYNKAVQTFYKLDQTGNYSEALTYADMNILPMGIHQTKNNIDITIAVSDIRWETAYTELTVFARIKIPQNDLELMFGAQGIKLSYNGDIVGDASLVLLQDVEIPINGNTANLVLKGNFSDDTGRGDQLTYVTIDCQGFSELGVAADIEFSRSLLVPLDEKGEKSKDETKKVTGSFQTVVTDWNDILVSVALPSFEINGLDDFTFSLGEAVFDFSDVRNDLSVVFPTGYADTYLVSGSPQLWRGVYVRDVTVTLPPQFKDHSKVRPSFLAQNMIIDNNGISGIFSGLNILPIDRGSASGWRFSVDQFTLALEANQLTAAQFAGKIGLPVSDNSNLKYEGYITADNEYYLKTTTLDSVKFDVFAADATLSPNSYITLKVVDGEFKPEAMLHGSLTMAPTLASGKKVGTFEGIQFQSLHLKTESPKFTAEYFGYKGNISMMNFPVSVSGIGLKTTGDEVSLELDLSLTLSDNLFAGSTHLSMVGAEKETVVTTDEEGATVASQQWVYKKLEIDKVTVKASIAEVFTLEGSLEILDDDPTYGDGFSGAISLTFSKILEGMKVETRAMFGRTDFRYWFVDGTVAFPGGIPVFPPLKITGFGGGIAYHMKRKADVVAAAGTKCTYVPDEDVSLGIKSAVLFAAADDKVLNGEASFEIAFNDGGGLNYIGFYGYAKFLATIPGVSDVASFVDSKYNAVVKMQSEVTGSAANTLATLKQYDPNEAAKQSYPATEEPGQAGFAAAMGVTYDFTQNSLHATFDLYVNALNGMLAGSSSGNRAGWAVLHIDPSEWYLRMGTPEDRLGVKMSVGGMVNVAATSYLMIGDDIPASPAPPQQVADILGVDMDELDYMRDLNALGEGRGFAFGASLQVATGDITFLVLYANFQAGVGFDIMLKDYGDIQCEGHSGAIGMDGWYANGQAYTYLQGELGIKVNLWFLKTKVPIIQGAAAALLQAKLPNPVYFKGYLGVKFNVLGGLVSGSCRFKLELGEECELVIPGGSPLDMRMISDLTPQDAEDNIDVFTAPQATFAMKVGEAFQIEDDDGVQYYRISLNEFTVSQDGQAIDGQLKWNSDQNAVSFYSKEVLPSEATLNMSIKVGFEKWNNSKWATVYTSGELAQEIMETTFTTSTAPDVIPLENVAYAYPVIDQKFFLKDESTTGFIQLKRGQSYLFSDDYTHEVELTDATGAVQAASFTYNTGTNRLQYTLPAIETGSSYAFQLVTLNTDDGAETTTTVSTENVGTDDDEINVNTVAATDVVRTDVGAVLLAYNFTTSQYSTLQQKVSALVKQSAVASTSAGISLRYNVTAEEGFEPMELAGVEYTDYAPLVQVEADLKDDYFVNTINPLLYQNYPVEGIRYDRDTDVFGLPPARAISVYTPYLTEIEQDNYQGVAAKYFPYSYNLHHAYQQDFADLQTGLVMKYLDTPRQGEFANVISGRCPVMPVGNYGLTLQYVLPDGTQGTTAVFEFYNFIK